MKPRYASAVFALENYARQVFRCSVDEWRRLPVQWRGFLLFDGGRTHTAQSMLKTLERGQASTEYDPQGVFDAFQGLAPA